MKKKIFFNFTFLLKNFAKRNWLQKQRIRLKNGCEIIFSPAILQQIVVS